MGYLHHAQEVIELTNYQMATIRYNSWNTDTNQTGKGTEYTLEVTLTTPKEYSKPLYDDLTKKGYNVTTRNGHTLEVTLKTRQAKKRETLTDSISDSVYSYFENERVL